MDWIPGDALFGSSRYFTVWINFGLPFGYSGRVRPRDMLPWVCFLGAFFSLLVYLDFVVLQWTGGSCGLLFNSIAMSDHMFDSLAATDAGFLSASNGVVTGLKKFLVGFRAKRQLLPSVLLWLSKLESGWCDANLAGGWPFKCCSGVWPIIRGTTKLLEGLRVDFLRSPLFPGLLLFLIVYCFILRRLLFSRA